jgi:hypothetical protein
VKLYIIITKDGIARISKYPQIWTLKMGKMKWEGVAINYQ